MRTLNLTISDFEYNQLGIIKDNITFTELVDLINKEINRQALNKCVQIAEKYGLSKMDMDEITDEVKVIRSAKNNS